MKYTKNKYIKYKRAELERFLKDNKSCVKKVNRTEILAVSPHHLSSIKNYITCVLDAKIGKHHRDLDGIVLDFRNVKLLNTNSELRFEDPLVRLTIIVDYYVFRPHRGAVLRGIIKHTNQHSLGVILYRVFTVSIRLNDAQAGKRLAINQEIEFKVIGFNFENKFACIDGEFIKSYKLPAAVKVNGNHSTTGSIKKFDESDEEEVEPPSKAVVKQETAAGSSSSEEDEHETRKPVIKKEKPSPPPSQRADDDSDSSSSDEQRLPTPVIKKEKVTPPQSSSDSDEAETNKSKVKQEAKKKPVPVKHEPLTNGYRHSDSSSSEDEDEEEAPKNSSRRKILTQVVKQEHDRNGDVTESSDDEIDNFLKANKSVTKTKVKQEPVNGDSESSEDEIDSILQAHKVVTVKSESANKRKRRRESSSSSDSSDTEKVAAPPAKRTNTESFERKLLAPVRRRLLQSQSDSDDSSPERGAPPQTKIKSEKVDTSRRNTRFESEDEDDFDRSISALLTQFKTETPARVNGKVKKEQPSLPDSQQSILKTPGSAKAKGRKSVHFVGTD